MIFGLETLANRFSEPGCHTVGGEHDGKACRQWPESSGGGGDRGDREESTQREIEGEVRERWMVGWGWWRGGVGCPATSPIRGRLLPTNRKLA